MAKTETAAKAEAAVSPLLAGIERTIELVEAEARALAQEQAPQAAQRSAAGAVGGAADRDAQGHSLEDLTVFLSRLKQMKDWLQDDQRLLGVVDGYIGQRVTAMEKRSNAFNIQLAVITTLVGALLGWILSAVSGPSQLLSLIHH
jgi:hypothetical protein